jgi:uncharacterized protein (TIGR03382 family)
MNAAEGEGTVPAAGTAVFMGLGAVAAGRRRRDANVMVIAVLERRSEIGIRRALGATRGSGTGSCWFLQSRCRQGLGWPGGRSGRRSVSGRPCGKALPHRGAENCAGVLVGADGVGPSSSAAVGLFSDAASMT